MFYKITSSEYFKYFVAGGLTTIISLLTFYFFIKVGLDYKIATVLSFVISASFAFMSNKVYVFEHKSNSFMETLNSYLSFMVSRLFTLAVDFFGMIFLVQFIELSEMYSKLLVNVIIFILNYLISKLFIFKLKKESEDR